MMHDLPPLTPVEIARSDKLRAALQQSGVGKTECDRKDQSPVPGCDRAARVSTMAFQLHRLEQAETNPTIKALFRDAIASLGEILAAS